MIIQTELARLRALCDAATPGPWEWREDLLREHWHRVTLRAPECPNRTQPGKGLVSVITFDGQFVPRPEDQEHIAAWSPDRARRFVALAEAAWRMSSEMQFIRHPAEIEGYLKALRAALASCLEEP